MVVIEDNSGYTVPDLTKTEKRNYRLGLYANKVIRQHNNAIEGYCILWDMKYDPVVGYFSKETVIENLDSPIPVTIVVDGKPTVIGYAVLTRDDFGVYAVAKIGTPNDGQVRYVDAINSLVDKEIARFTTSATFENHPDVKHVDEKGMITLWPVYSLHIITGEPKISLKE